MLVYILLFGLTLSYNGFYKVFEPSGGEYEQARDVTKLTDGNYAVCGHSGSSGYITEGNIGWVFKLTPDGSEVVWSKFFQNYTVHFYGISAAPGGHMIVSGRYNSIPDESNKGYAIRLSGDGDVVWETTWGCGANQMEGFYRGIPHSDGSYMFVGDDNGCYGNSNEKPYILKADASTGEAIWGTAITGIDQSNFYSEYYRGLVEAGNGDVVLAGSGDFAYSAGGDCRFMLVALDADSGGISEAFNWNRTDAEVHSCDYGGEMILTSDGGIAMAIAHNINSENYFGMMKWNSNYELEFITGFRRGTDYERGKVIMETSDGTFLVGGSAYDGHEYFSPCLALFDSDGTVLSVYSDTGHGTDDSDNKEGVKGLDHMGGDFYIYSGNTFNHTHNIEYTDGFVGTVKVSGDKLEVCGDIWVEVPLNELTLMDDAANYQRNEWSDIFLIQEIDEESEHDTLVYDKEVNVLTLADDCEGYIPPPDDPVYDDSAKSMFSFLFVVVVVFLV